MADSITSLSYGSVAASSSSSALSASATSSSIGYDPAPYLTAWTAKERSFLRSVNAGLYIGAVLLGIHTIAVVCALIGARHHKQTTHRVLFSVIPVVLWAMALIFEACSFAFATQALDVSEDEANSHAQYTYWEMNLDAGLNVAAAAAFLVSTVVTDGFLYGRCVALWSSKWCTIPLGLFLLATYAFDLMHVYRIGAWADQSLWVIPGFTPNVVSVALAQALHIFLVALLLTRLVAMHRKSTSKRWSAGVGGLAVESALLYGIVSVLWLGACCAQNVAANAFLTMYVQLQGITVDLMITRWGRLERERTPALEVSAPVNLVRFPGTFEALSNLSSADDNEKPASRSDQGHGKRKPVPPADSV